MAGAAFVKLSMDNAELQKGIAEAQSKIQRFAAGINAFSSKIALMGPLISVPFIAAARTFAQFDDQMRLTSAVTGATAEQFGALTEQAKRLGRETSFSAAQVASGMTELGRMGFSPEQIQQAIKPMMDLARATGTDLATAAQIAANNMSVFKIAAADSSSVADILTVTANSSAQTLTDLGEALKMAAPHAARAGATLKDTAAYLGILANMGIRGSLAGTALGKSFKRLADTEVSDYLRQCGIETRNLVTGDMRNLKDILIDIAKYMNNLNNVDKINFAETVFDARGSLGGGMLSVNVDKIDELMKKLDDSSGAAQKTADEMDRGLGGTLRRLASAAEGVSIAIGEIMDKSFRPLIESAAAFANVLTEVIQNSETLGEVLKLGGAVIGFGLVIKAISMTAGAIKTLYSPLAALNSLIVGNITSAHQTGIRWSKVHAAAMGKLSSANLFAAAASRKHAAAVMQTSVAEMAAARAGAGASAIRTAGYYAEAVGAKAAAAASMALNSVLNFLAANPVTVAMLALYGAYKAVSLVSAQAAAEAEKESRIQARLAGQYTAERQDLEKRIQTEQSQIQKLIDLERQGKLTAAQQLEAQKIIEELSRRYSNLGITIDTVTGKLTGATAAFQRMNQIEKQSMVNALEKEAKQYQASADAMRRGFNAKFDWWDKTVSAVSGGSANRYQLMEMLGFGKESGKWELTDFVNTADLERMQKALIFAQDNGMDQEAEKIKQIIAQLQKRLEVEQKIKSLKGEKNTPVTAAPEEPTAKRIGTKELAAAEKELARIEEANARNKMSNLEREIADIEKVKQKYLELAALKKADLQAELAAAQKRMKANEAGANPVQKDAYEAAKKAAETAQNQLDALEKRIGQAQKDFSDQRKQAEDKEQERIRKENQKYLDFLPDLAARQQQKQDQKNQDSQFDNLLKDRSDSGRTALNNFFANLEQDLEGRKAAYRKMLQDAQNPNSIGGANISESEKKNLEDLQKEINSSMEKIENYRARIENSQQEVEKNTSQKSMGIFNAADIDAISPQKPIEKVNQNLETIKSILSKINRNTQSGGLAFS